MVKAFKPESNRQSCISAQDSRRRAERNFMRDDFYEAGSKSRRQQDDSVGRSAGVLGWQALIFSEPGGFSAVSRWLREARATPPEHRFPQPRIPEGCQP